MKLDNKGWSLNTLLICMAVMLSFLIISIFYVFKFTNSFKQSPTDVNYTNNYSSNNYTQISDNTNNENDNNNDDTDAIADSSDNEEQENSTKYKYYITKEQQLQAGTIRYLKENAISVADDETVIINANDIINKKYIQTIKDERTNNICDGYSTVKFADNDYVVKAYIDCDSYTSNDYGVEE